MTTQKPEEARLLLNVPKSLADIADTLGEERNANRNQVINEWLCHGAEESAIRLLDRGKSAKAMRLRPWVLLTTELTNCCKPRAYG